MYPARPLTPDHSSSVSERLLRRVPAHSLRLSLLLICLLFPACVRAGQWKLKFHVDGTAGGSKNPSPAIYYHYPEHPADGETVGYSQVTGHDAPVNMSLFDNFVNSGYDFITFSPTISADVDNMTQGASATGTGQNVSITLTWTWQPQDGDMASDPPPDTLTVGYKRKIYYTCSCGVEANPVFLNFNNVTSASGNAQASSSINASLDGVLSAQAQDSRSVSAQYPNSLSDQTPYVEDALRTRADAGFVVETLPVSNGVASRTMPVTWQLNATANAVQSAEYVLVDAEAGCSVQFTVQAFAFDVNLIGDTNRDGVITDVDVVGKQTWSNTRGAIYIANYNADNSRRSPAGGSLPQGTIIPDAIYFNDTGIAEYENTKMGNDSADIALLLIKAMPAITFTTPGVKAFLKVPELEDIRAVHLYKQIAPNEPVFWGGTAETRTEVDITSLVNNETDMTLGIEGLYLKGMTLPLPNDPKHIFDGIVDFVLEIRQNNTILSRSKVEFKVAPWLMLPNTQPSTSVWALSRPAPDFYNNAAFITGLQGSQQLSTEPWGATTQNVWGSAWFQDHAEIGYMQRPGGSKVMSVFRLPYYRGMGVAQPLWPVLDLLSPVSGMFQLGATLIPNNLKPSGDYGGNVELMPPMGDYKLGRIVVGDTISTPLFNFLSAQEAQYPIKIPTSWLDVGHVDEAIAFGPAANQIISASPAKAYAILNDRNIIPDPNAAVFFATGTKAPVVGTVTDLVAPGNYVFATGMGDFTNTTWNYIRIISGSGAGQVGHIKERRKKSLILDRVYDTGARVLDTNGGITLDCMGKWATGAMCPSNTTGTWFRPVAVGDQFVLVEGTQFWDTAGPVKVPAIVTVQELLNDTKLKELNDKVEAKMTVIQDLLEGYSGDVGAFAYIPVPVLYIGDNSNFDKGRTAFAFTPGLSNVQFVGNSLYFPKQFAPGSATAGNDCFQNAVTSQLMGTTCVFLDDWNLYHRDEGEVHCGTATIRRPFAFDWWNNLH